jgi:hypothetical protein
VVGKHLKHNKSLLRLHLAANEITAPGMKALCKALQGNHTVTELNVSWNRFGPEGAKHLGDLLSKNSGLQELHLSHNKIGCDGAAALAQGLRLNTALQNIDLSSNRIRVEGREQLSRALTSNLSLLWLNLAGNQLPVPGADNDLEGCLRRNMNMNVTSHKLALLMAFHGRLGGNSPLATVFHGSDIGDKNVLRYVWEMLWSSTDHHGHALPRLKSMDPHHKNPPSYDPATFY